MSNKPDMERVIQVLISLLEEQEHVEITYLLLYQISADFY